MDQPSRPVDPRERAVSSEPCSTRANPFDDTDLSARKRRRTSLTSGSRSKSVDSIDSRPDLPTTFEDEALPDSAMKVDSVPTDPNLPQTPDRQLGPAETETPAEPLSSRVTINLRNAPQSLDGVPASPISTGSPVPKSQEARGDDVRISVEESEVDMAAIEGAADNTPLSSTVDVGSPPVEVVAVQPDEDSDLEDPEPQVMILQDIDGALIDPTGSFPYHEAHESYPESAAKLTQYMASVEVVSKLNDWTANYLEYRKAVDYIIAFESYQEFRDFWHTVPELAWVIIQKKIVLGRNRALRQELSKFVHLFAKLTASFVELDNRTLRRLSEMSGTPDLVSLQYVGALALLTRGDDYNLHGSHSQNGESSWSHNEEFDDVLDSFQTYTSNAGGSLAHLCKFAQEEVVLVSRFPKLIDSFGSICMLVCNFARVNCRKLQTPSGNSEAAAKTFFRRAYTFFVSMSAALASIIDKHVTHLSTDCATHQILALTEIYHLCLYAGGSEAISSVIKEHRQSHPEIFPETVAEALSSKWRMNMYSNLITSSQMQLRVMAATSMCSELVHVWKKCSETYEESNTALLNYFSEFLLQTGLIEYILGPTCHPEITIESANIIGFLVVTKTYTNQHTDLLWRTITSSKDPRVSDALLRMTGRITNLFYYEGLIYLCEKLNTVPAEAFAQNFRDLCDAVFRHLQTKYSYDRTLMDPPPYTLCVRLIKESSVSGPQSAVAFPDLQNFAIQKFRELLAHGNPDGEGRRGIYLECLKDVKDKSPTALGSLWTIFIMLRTHLARELHLLTVEFNFTQLLVDELEAAIKAGRETGFLPVINGSVNTPRRELILGVLLHQPKAITKDLGPRLWDMLVGTSASCREDRDAAWLILNSSLQRSRLENSVRSENSFMSTCFTEYLPTLPPECFCEGALEFVREGVLPLVNDPTSTLLDSEESPDHGGIEQLWRMVLTAPEHTIEQQAIHTLVNDVYVDSRSILSFSHDRARKVHLGLVDRCLRQMSSAAAKLKEFSDGTASGDDEPMVIVATDSQVKEEELLFIRSLCVLREFHRLHQAKAHFAAPDLRSLILETPGAVEGDPAELKYQSFDGDVRTDVMPLNIGKRNTAGSLLASLRDATGFDNYRIYYRGKAFVPQESDICKSLEELQIHGGLILVKREAAGVSASANIRPGASPVEIEVLGHFRELWDYLSMEERLGREIYNFLTKLPVDDKVMEAFESPSSSYKQVFPVGEPFKSLYALNALREHLSSQRGELAVAPVVENDSESDEPSLAYQNSLSTAIRLVVAALSDPDVIGRCGSQDLQIQLGTELVECFVLILNDSHLPESASEHLNADLLEHLIGALSSATSINSVELAIRPIYLSFQAILDSCAESRDFWTAFCEHDKVPPLIQSLLLDDPREPVRKHTSKLIQDKIASTESSSAVTALDFREFFWPLVSGLIPAAAQQPSRCDEAFELSINMFKALRSSDAAILDVHDLLDVCCRLLKGHTTYEDMTQPEVGDIAANGLTKLMHGILCWGDYPVDREILPPIDYARDLFWRHLFPPFETTHRSARFRPILHPQTRTLLVEIVFALVGSDQSQLGWLIHDLNELVPFYGDGDEDEPYAYELPPQFERSKAVRSSCGYVGLKNLSNTCYLNSLFTQLFMNIDFRAFMLNERVQDAEYSQGLLFQTQKLFSFLQHSTRRFVNPEDCVSSIKTYEDTQIDIHNQMDVDEFYNLLFDRWEGQILSGEAKRKFRSFYGGQLVQQVTSKECDHVSEMLEPFSAIQCDIKGKTSLQESLQAYVDGEIMAGDNKYKCSTCDRHVDAVKRACLKDIPDNLIFHLKRFDFNLRTLQRSKINDHFAFPTRIDMRPYTIEHLSNQAQDMPEDVFELVGVLVHSGTAESGHYYSYIRERPSSSPSEVWIEFNDDVVSPWDPSNMESSCFGGPDYRTPFDGNGAVYDKTYSAYMLFYQRSSCLQEKQDQLARSGERSPIKVRMPQSFQQYIERENLSILRRHCLFDQSHILLVTGAMSSVKPIVKDQCSADHEMENTTLQMALSHLDQVASRAKDLPDFEVLYGRIDDMGQACVHCSAAIYEYFNDRHEPLRMLLQRNPEPGVRQDTADLVIRCLQSVKVHLPEQYGLVVDEDEEFDLNKPIINGIIRMFKMLWDNFHVNLRSWHEVFGFMLSFVDMGRLETAAFLEQDFLRKLLLVVSADPNLEMPAQFVRMITSVQRRMATRPPSYDNILGLMAALLSTMRHQAGERGEPELVEYPEERVDNRQDTSARPFLLTKAEYRILYQDWQRGLANVFAEKLIGINQNQAATHSILVNLLQLTRPMDTKIFHTLRGALAGQATSHQQTPYLRAAVVYCRFSARKDMIATLIRHVCAQCVNLQNAEGRAYLEFQRDVFDGPRENSGETAEQIEDQGLKFLSDWTPGLLTHFEHAVGSDTEAFLNEKLFKHGPAPDFGEDDAARERSRAMDEAARSVGIGCLVFVRDNYVVRRTPIGSRTVAALQRVVAKAEKYFRPDDDGNRDKAAEDFLELKQEVFEALRRLTVEDLEEDPSGMLMMYSDDSSVTSSVTAG